MIKTYVIQDGEGYWHLQEANDQGQARRNFSGLEEEASLDGDETILIGIFEENVTEGEVEFNNCSIAMEHGYACQCGMH